MLAFKSHIDEIRDHLGAAIIQTLPTDDQIIVGHMRSAHAIAKVIGREMAAADAPDLLATLRDLLNRYTALVQSGDCGFWDVEKEDCVIAARAAIARVEAA